MICIPYYNSPTYAIFSQDHWNEILSHLPCVEQCSLCRYAKMIRETISDVPLPPVGANRADIDQFAKSAVAIATKKRFAGSPIAFSQESARDFYGNQSRLNTQDTCKADEKKLDGIYYYFGIKRK
jgi:hypothetical protein